ncbi:VWA domain-containing protein [Nostoc sp. HG1]|nr:VWA domain-containing protein [Nostoc sp. HG1]
MCKLKAQQLIKITSNLDRGKLKQIISSLQAEGVRTHTGKAVQKALEHSALLNKRADALGRTVSIVFLTDGLEDVRGIPNPVSIPSNTQFLTEQQCKPYIFFVSLGLKEHEKQLNDFASNPALCGKGQVLRDPGGVELNKLAENIRPVLITPKLDVTAVPAIVRYVLNPKRLQKIAVTRETVLHNSRKRCIVFPKKIRKNSPKNRMKFFFDNATKTPLWKNLRLVICS